MPNHNETALVHRRTVEEAVARGDARERIRTAQGVRATGLTLLAGGIGLLSRTSTWRPYNQALGIHIHGGPSFTLSFTALAGGLALVISPMLIVTGQLLLSRATIAAAENPVTATILDEPEQ
jgi:hypothetical protein